MASTAEAFGRVDADGTVSVRDGDNWRVVGSYPDGSPDEALAYFQRKYDELQAMVTLAEQRLKASAPTKDLRQQITKLTADLREPAAVGDLASLRQRVAAVEAELPAREEQQKAESQIQVAQALEFRTSLVVEMEKLSGQDPAKIRWKQATDSMTSLFEQWQNHQQTGPRLPKKEADELWSRFRKARTSLEKARRTHFHELDERSKEAKTIKRDLITQAEALADKGAAGIPAYRALLEKWKAAPRASRSVEDSLWTQFKAAGDILYAEKAAADKKDDEVNSVNFEQKSALLDEFADVLAVTNRDEAAARLRLFHQRFAQIGPVPKKHVRAIDDRVKKLDAHVKSLEAEFWQKNDPEKKARSDSMADQLRASIGELESRIASASDAEKKDLEAELETKRAWLAVVDA
jgi:hypothetical protein